MNTNRSQPGGEQLQGRSEPSVVRSWNVVLNGEIIGTVHGETRQRALEVISVLRMPELKIEPAN